MRGPWPTMPVQRTAAGRHAEWRCRRSGWLAPVAELSVRQPGNRNPGQEHHDSNQTGLQDDRMITYNDDTEKHPVHPAILSKTDL
jgi:hypothetical protein